MKNKPMKTSSPNLSRPIGWKPLISVVTPCFNEEENIQRCYEAVQEVFAGMPGYEYEHVFCDNASSDRSRQILEELALIDPRVKVILNARNFGPVHSAHNGFLAASGDAVVVSLAADLQDPAEVIPEFVAKWRDGCKVVYGVREKREESFVMRSLRRIYYRLVKFTAEIEIPVDAGYFQLVDRSVADAIAECPDQYPFLPGLIAYCGFRKEPVKYTWRARQFSVSKATLPSMIDQTLNALTSFSKAPLRLAFAGVVVLLLAAMGSAAIALSRYLTSGEGVGVWSLAAVMCVLGSIQLGAIGVLGEYIAAIHRQVRPRPIVVEQQRINFDSVEETVEMALPTTARRSAQPRY